MSAADLFQLLAGSGAFTAGIAVARWVYRTENRLTVLEVKAKIV